MPRKLQTCHLYQKVIQVSTSWRAWNPLYWVCVFNWIISRYNTRFFQHRNYMLSRTFDFRTDTHRRKKKVQNYIPLYHIYIYYFISFYTIFISYKKINGNKNVRKNNSNFILITLLSIDKEIFYRNWKLHNVMMF